MSIRVFHLDDNPDETALFGLLLAGQEDVELVGSVNAAAELLSALADLEPDVLVMDYKLDDGADPGELIRRVIREFPRTSVVCLTGYEHPKAVQEIKASGAFAHVAKGAPLETVLETIRGAARNDISTRT